MKLSWKFPVNHGGEEEGHNDSGVMIFKGAKIPSLAREIIQNSMDARLPLGGGAVKVEFNLVDLPADDFPNRDELLTVFKSCLKMCEQSEADEKVTQFYRGGIQILSNNKTIKLLQVSDYNTTGLTEKPDDLFHKLAKTRGASNKGAQAGGSFGIGKAAPYTVSDLRTVFYSTMYYRGKTKVQKAQGRAVLMTHLNGKGERTRGTGFYGDNTKIDCKPIRDKHIPDFMSRDTVGTTVWIAGFNAGKDWGDRVAESVLANFFVAIQRGDLEVSITDTTRNSSNKYFITKDSLQQYFDEFCPEDSPQTVNADDSKIRNARLMYEALQRSEPVEFELRSGLGSCRLWVLAGEGFPRVVGMVRRTGMLITTQLPHLSRFYSTPDFVAICICDSEKGNKLLRSMENPEHNAFQPDRLEVEEKIKQGDKALLELANRIRAEVKESVSPEPADSEELHELTRFFHDVDGDPAKKGDGENDFEAGIRITKAAPRKSKSSRKSSVISRSGDDFDFDDVIQIQPERKKRERKHPRSGSDRYSIGIQRIRVVKTLNKNGLYEVFFTPSESGNVELSFKIVGDQLDNDDILPLSPECQKRAKSFAVEKGKRASFVLETPHNITEAIRVDAYMPINEPSSDSQGDQE